MSHHGEAREEATWEDHKPMKEAGLKGTWEVG